MDIKATTGNANELNLLGVAQGIEWAETNPRLGRRKAKEEATELVSRALRAQGLSWDEVKMVLAAL